MVEDSERFPPHFECVAAARRFVRHVLAGWGLDGIEEPASLLVTELATNAVLHARTEFQVTVAFDGESLRVGVSDGSVRTPTAKARSRQAATGRGMSLIAAFADSWRVEPRPGGKTVWCVLAHRPFPERGEAGRRAKPTGHVAEQPPPPSGRSHRARDRAAPHRHAARSQAA